MDLLRRAVGDAKLTYAGYSYGSYLGATYANLFPGKVRALVVDGVLDPVAWSTGRGDQARTLPFSTRLRSAKGAYETLQEFFRLCDAGGPNCAFSEGDPARRFDRLAKRLLREPVEFPDGEGGTFLVTYAELIGATLGVLYDPAAWPDWAVVLQQLWELTSPAAAAASLQALRARLGAGVPAGGLPQLRRGLPRGGLLRDPQPVQRRRLVAGGQGPGPPVPLLRPALDLVLQHLPALAGLGRRPLRRPLEPHHRQPGAGRRQPGSTRPPATRGRSPSTGCCPGRGCSPWPAGGTPRCSSSACVDAYVSTLLPDLAGAAQGHGLRARRGAVRRAGRRPDRAGERGQQGRADPVAAAEAAGRLSDPATLSLTGRRLTTCLAS